MTDLLRHPEDSLSALLDGELPEHEAAVVHAHVIACSDCSAELDAVRATRLAVRSLPAVEPPPGFLEHLLAGGLPEDPELAEPATVHRMSPRRMAVANAAAAVVAGLVLVTGFGGAQPAAAVAPEVSGAVQQHSATVSAVSAGLGGGLTAPSQSPSRSSGGISRPFSAPTELGDYELVEAFQLPEGLQLLYANGPYRLSVFEQEGQLDLEDLPAEGTRIGIGGDDAWRWDGPMGRGMVIVLERGDLVVTLVGEETPGAVRAAADAFPGSSRREGWSTRLQRACGDALELLSPAG